MVRDFFDAYDKYSDREAGTTTYVDENDNEISEEEALRKMVGIEVKKATDELKATIEKMMEHEEKREESKESEEERESE